MALPDLVFPQPPIGLRSVLSEDRHMNSFIRSASRIPIAISTLIALLALMVVTFVPNNAQAQTQPDTYALNEMVDAGHRFFGSTSTAVAQTLEQVFSRYGLPNGYILGQEGSGAFIGGLTYGEGTLHTKNVGDHNVFWQGPSLGWDYGGEGARTMMLVYNLDSLNNLHGRYGGVAGSAYLVAGAGMHVLRRNNVMLVPVRTGVGARLGVSVGYLKLTPMPTWNPF